MRQPVRRHQSDALPSIRHMPMKLKSITLPLKSGSASSASVCSGWIALSSFPVWEAGGATTVDAAPAEYPAR